MQKLSMKKADIAALILALCLLLSAVAWIYRSSEKGGPSTSNEAGYSALRHIQYGFTLQNDTNHLLEKAELWTYAPVAQTATQRCLSLETSHPHDLIVDAHGNQILHFAFENLPPYGVLVLSIRADLALSNMPKRTAVSNREDFLKAERYVECDHPEVLRIARELKRSSVNLTAEAIFDWVAGNLRNGGYLRNDRGALYALKKRGGDCTEFAYLFVALCRANKIPAKALGGYVCDKDRILKAQDYHNWAEFYEDGAWQLADPQRKVFMQNPSHYISMRVIAESADETKHPMGEFHRFRFSGDGLKVRMNP